MTSLFIRLFVHNAHETENPKVRGRYIALGTVCGIICNLFLAGFKISVGLLSGSAAITADGFNNLSDTGSAFITQIGYRLSARPGDRNHPFGHGRLEYISALAVGGLILLVGVELFKSSVKLMFKPETVRMNVITLVLLAVSILVKLWMFLFQRKIGKTISAKGLLATAQDSLNDCVATLAVLISSALFWLSNGTINIDAYISAAVALFILYSGFITVKETIQPLLGLPPEKETVHAIHRIVHSYSKFTGIHDLIIHNYGPGRSFATLHVEVPCDVDIIACHEDIDDCERRIKQELGLEIVLHMDPIATNDELTNTTRQKVLEGLKIIDSSLSMHDFRMVDGKNNINLIFDVVCPPGFPLNETELTEKIQSVCRLLDKRYTAVVTVDRDYAPPEE